MLNEEVFEAAIKKYGHEVQIGMAQEEMGELLVAINHLKRNRIEFSAFMEEVVDVHIMMSQLRYMDPKLFDNLYEVKVARVRKRLGIDNEQKDNSI